MVNLTHYKMRISKKNEVYLILDDMSESTRRELTEFFTFEVPGARFMPMYRKRIWDGKIRLFSPANGEIYVGLLDYVTKYCDDNNVSYELEEGVRDERNIVREVARGKALSKVSNLSRKENPSKYETTKLMLYASGFPEIVLLLLVLLLLVSL